MARTFLTGNDVRFTPNGRIYVDAELYSGEVYTKLEPRRLFPVTGAGDYITFLDENGEEKFIIRHLKELPKDQQDIIGLCLWEYYRIPKITRIINRIDTPNCWTWTVDTDRGEFTFETHNFLHDVKVLYDNRVLISDSKDNRYEIPDYTKLDRQSMKIMQHDV